MHPQPPREAAGKLAYLSPCLIRTLPHPIVFSPYHGHFHITYCKVPRKMKAGKQIIRARRCIFSLAFPFEWSFLLSRVYEEPSLWFCSTDWWVPASSQRSQVLSIPCGELVTLQIACSPFMYDAHSVILWGARRLTATLTWNLPHWALQVARISCELLMFCFDFVSPAKLSSVISREARAQPGQGSIALWPGSPAGSSRNNFSCSWWARAHPTVFIWFFFSCNSWMSGMVGKL